MQQEDGGFPVGRIVHYWSRQFQEAMQIYSVEFPADSRLSVATIRTLLKGGQYQLFVTHEEGTVLGFALIWISRHPALSIWITLPFDRSRRDEVSARFCIAG